MYLIKSRFVTAQGQDAMDLLEYQAKELFREMGIPVLPSQPLHHPTDLKTLKIPYPVVLKSQVRRGGRGRAGGIKFVTNTIDAIAAAQSIFGLPIMGEYPEILLAEAKYDADREFYLAVALDSSARRPVLLGSQQGGIGVESAIDQMQQVIVDQEFSSFYARRLVLKMGLQGPLIQSVSQIVEKMYQLFVQKDLELLEINPLGINANGELMALDGKVTVNDGALNRHPELLALLTRKEKAAVKLRSAIPAFDPPITAAPVFPPPTQLEGNIAILCNGAGLTMTTLDLVYKSGGKPANFLNVGGETHSSLPIQERVQQGLTLVTESETVRVVLINILGGANTCEAIAQVIYEFVQKYKQHSRVPHFVVRLVGKELDTAHQLLEQLQIPLIDQLNDAVAHAVALSK